MNQRDRGITSFSKPPVEVVKNMANRNLSSEQQAQRDMMDQIKSGGRPVGGVPPVKIPPLDAEPLKGGGTMTSQAAPLSDPRNPLSPAYSPELAAMAAKQGGPFSTLPEEAKQDPRFRAGVGSMIAENQPHLASPPAPSGERKPILREETQRDLEKLASFQQTAENIQQKALDEQDKQVEEEIAKDSATYSAEINAILNDDDINLLNNPTRRKDVESRLSPLNIEDILVYGELRQEVPVVPGKTKYEFRSTTGEEDLAVKRMMFGETGGDRYMIDKFGLMNLALGLVAINGMALPSHLNDKKRFDETLFIRKYETLMKFPVQLLADMSVQYMWFDQRVRRLFVKSAEALKNS
ncbi:hypothetical protein UFOVP276_171 [uncultured Caudovirales phage]|uniref:Uncharacterized protein n=1 Tax=uncultured Caudovirales phage TaxID=2100421 RepID=A0A6J5LLT0_9CAUD|nr:hypothetical protein UFOVP127_65 [uncultured Caudovirales phage]CAB4135215.1 hypothetical protein UFOVP276_171 [uncultured Caudovirales phage]